MLNRFRIIKVAFLKERCGFHQTLLLKRVKACNYELNYDKMDLL